MQIQNSLTVVVMTESWGKSVRPSARSDHHYYYYYIYILYYYHKCQKNTSLRLVLKLNCAQVFYSFWVEALCKKNLNEVYICTCSHTHTCGVSAVVGWIFFYPCCTQGKSLSMSLCCFVMNAISPPKSPVQIHLLAAVLVGGCVVVLVGSAEKQQIRNWAWWTPIALVCNSVEGEPISQRT